MPFCLDLLLTTHAINTTTINKNTPTTIDMVTTIIMINWVFSESGLVDSTEADGIVLVAVGMCSVTIVNLV